jgi:hypothetical protein
MKDYISYEPAIPTSWRVANIINNEAEESRVGDKTKCEFCLPQIDGTSSRIAM